MSWQAAAWFLFGGSTALMLLGLPVAFSFLAINIVGAVLFLGGDAGLVQLARNSVDSVANFALTPIPMFVLMGEVLFHTGLAVKVLDAVERLITKVPGRLAVVAIVAGTIFSAISGSTIAVTAMLGSLMVPVMLERGYHPVMATGPIIAVGALDMLMPVSALAVLLGSLSGISIPRLLMGGFVPGMVLKGAFIIYIVARVKLDPSLAPATQFVVYHGWAKTKPLVKYVFPILSIFLVVVASMSLGLATPTESAAVGAFATVVLALAYGALTRDNLLTALRGTISISGMILFIIVGATTFSQISVVLRGQRRDRVADRRARPVQGRDHRRDDADPDFPGHLCRSSEHDADHAADLHAGRAEARHRSGLVRGDVPDLHAASGCCCRRMACC